MRRSLWIEYVFRPLIIGAMVGCIVWSVVQLVLMLAPAWNPTFLLVGCVLAALEGSYSYRLLQTTRMFGTNVLRFRVGELALIFVALKIARFMGMSRSELMTQVQAWPYDLTLLFDPETIATFVLAFSCWWAAIETARDLDRIGEPAERHPAYVPPVQRITSRFFVGGAVMLVAAGLSRIGDTSELLNLRRPSVGGLVLNVLVYFLLGLVMLSQTRFVELRKRWQGQDVHVADQLAARWVRYSLSFIGLAALLAFVLPTGFTLRPLTVIGQALNLIASVVFYAGSLILFLLLLPFSWLLWLFSGLSGAEESRFEPNPPSFEPQQPLSEGGATMNWLVILVFAAIALATGAYVIRSYLSHRLELRATIVTLRPIQMLRRLWAALWRSLGTWGAHLRGAVRENLPRLIPGRSPRDKPLRLPFRFFRLGALSSRERVLYYYLSVLRRAGRQGFSRRGHQTPHEYYETMEPHLPQVQQDMGALTEAFVEARYSQHEVGVGQEQRVRGNWERVKAALRALKGGQDVQ
jgi:hypothetical protein